ncbi:MAG: DUF3048 domain-containing protein [Acidimicrobiales bacterium]|nr:DUF3048 domain-containing protein [Acidimicrobiales bacterium]
MKLSFLRKVACLCMVAAACSASAESAGEPSTLPLVDADAATTTTTTTIASTSVTTVQTDFKPAAGEVFSLPTSTTTQPVTTTTTAPKPATTSSSPGTPAVTQPSGDPQQPSSLYKGVLGTYTLDQVFASSPVANPTVASGTLPLTGVPGTTPSRPAIVVKVDNASRARPQSGLNKADIVIEEEVEFGITRFAAVYHTHDSTVGPVRSGRSTDISFLNALGSPGLVYSGANRVIDQLLLNQTNVANFSAARSSGYWRSSSRPAPNNLYSKTSSFSGVAPGGPPPAQFHFRPAGTPSSQGVESTGFGVHYPANKVRWDWDGSAWLRSQAGRAHTTDGERVSAANVVVVAVPSVATGLFDSTGAAVPEFVFVGEGPAAVFTDGRRVDGSWTRPTLRDPAILHVNGQAITLTPGRTWIQVTTSGQYQP